MASSLFDCNLAKGVRALLDEDIVDYIAASKQPDPKLWLFDLIDNLPSVVVVKVLVIMWAIWWAKQKAVHEKGVPKSAVNIQFYSEIPK